jgi:hypothetical protein
MISVDRTSFMLDADDPKLSSLPIIVDMKLLGRLFKAFLPGA